MSERTATAPVTATAPPAPAPRPALALALILTCQLMVVLDATIVNIALPDIQRSLHFSAAGLSWVLNAYALTFGGLLLLGGRAGDILGRRRVFTAGIVIFTASSLVGGFATTSGWLLAARAAQGVGGALASPTALALIATTAGDGAGRTRALGLYAAVSGAGSGLGLVLGGMLTSWVSWRWILFVNVPIGVALALLAPRHLPETERHRGRLDVTGALTSTLGMASLVYALVRASTDGWGDGVTLLAFVAAAVLLAAFVVNETRAPEPVLPLRLFADRTRAASYLMRLLLVGGMFGMFFFLTQFVQDVLGYSALRAGFAFLPLTVAIFLTSRVVPRLLPRYGHRTLAIVGALLTTGAMVWLTRITESSSYLGGLLVPMVMFGTGGGLLFVALTLLSLTGVAPRDAGAASGLVNAMQQLGGALGLAVLVTVFGAARTRAAHHPLAGADPTAQAHHVLASASATAFTVATGFMALTLLLALVVVRTPRDAPA